jgi:hypothetical protein
LSAAFSHYAATRLLTVESVVNVQAQVAGMVARVERIERQLGLADAQ